jgi:hypothetical protein
MVPLAARAVPVFGRAVDTSTTSSDPAIARAAPGSHVHVRGTTFMSVLLRGGDEVTRGHDTISNI